MILGRTGGGPGRGGDLAEKAKDSVHVVTAHEMPDLLSQHPSFGADLPQVLQTTIEGGGAVQLGRRQQPGVQGLGQAHCNAFPGGRRFHHGRRLGIIKLGAGMKAEAFINLIGLDGLRDEVHATRLLRPLAILGGGGGAVDHNF